MKFKSCLAASSGGHNPRFLHDGYYFPLVKRSLKLRGSWISSILPEPLPPLMGMSTSTITGYLMLPNLCPALLKFPTTPSNLAMEFPHQCRQLWARRGGITPEFLRCRNALCHRLLRSSIFASLNTRSLVNKMFLLNDFTSWDLDFMLLTDVASGRRVHIAF